MREKEWCSPPTGLWFLFVAALFKQSQPLIPVGAVTFPKDQSRRSPALQCTTRFLLL
eukprot:m.116251 g.116251  ORF g.116251 m.116251 type:complete len:57 (+) comp23029_c1_seq1:679-849(+)